MEPQPAALGALTSFWKGAGAAAFSYVVSVVVFLLA